MVGRGKSSVVCFPWLVGGGGVWGEGVGLVVGVGFGGCFGLFGCSGRLGLVVVFVVGGVGLGFGLGVCGLVVFEGEEGVWVGGGGVGWCVVWYFVVVLCVVWVGVFGVEGLGKGQGEKEGKGAVIGEGKTWIKDHRCCSVKDEYTRKLQEGETKEVIVFYLELKKKRSVGKGDAGLLKGKRAKGRRRGEKEQR